MDSGDALLVRVRVLEKTKEQTIFFITNGRWVILWPKSS
jgi:hypothetical protein